MSESFSERSQCLWAVLLRPHALFMVVRGIVTDSFFYPVVAIFRMAWFAAPLPAGLVDERPISEIVLAHILWDRAFILGLGVMSGYHCSLFAAPHPSRKCIIQICSQRGGDWWSMLHRLSCLLLLRQQWTLQMPVCVTFLDDLIKVITPAVDFMAFGQPIWYLAVILMRILLQKLHFLVHMLINWLQWSRIDPRSERPYGDQHLHWKPPLFLKRNAGSGMVVGRWLPWQQTGRQWWGGGLNERSRMAARQDVVRRHAN